MLHPARLPFLSAFALLLACAAATPGTADTAPPGLPLPPQVAGVPIPEGQTDRALARLDALAEAMVKRSGVPGLAVAVVRDGRTVYARGFGVRRLGEPAMVDADTVFQIASMSKSVGATCVARQVGRGVVAWDTPVTRHLPWFALADPWVTDHLTISDLYAHRSGLPDHAGDDLEDIGYDRRAVLEKLRLLPLDPFRIHYAYTNFGLTAAAEAVAVASGTDWASLCEEAIFTPLGMTTASFRHVDYLSRSNRAVLHTRTPGGFAPKYARNPDPQSPAGGVSASVNDVARWMALVLGNGSFEGSELIDPKALLPAITPQIVSSAAYAPDARASFYGYGFGVGVLPSGRTVISHSGEFGLGAATNFLIVPSAGIGITVLTNAAPVGAAEALAMEFVDLVQFGDVTRDWLAAFGAVVAPINAPFGSRVGTPVPPSPAPARAPDFYVGTYANAYLGDAAIMADGTALTMRLGPDGRSYRLTHLDGDVFTYVPFSENALDGSISMVSFAPGGSRAGSLSIELYQAEGMGTLTRR